MELKRTGIENLTNKSPGRDYAITPYSFSIGRAAGSVIPSQFGQ